MSRTKDWYEDFMEFQRYALELLTAEAEFQGRRIHPWSERGPDLGVGLVAPDGFGDLAGPAVVEVKSSIDEIMRIVTWLSVNNRASRFQGAIFVVFQQLPSSQTKLIKRDIEIKLPSLRISLLTSEDIDKLAERHAKVAAAYRPGYLVRAVATLSEQAREGTVQQSVVQAINAAFSEDNLVLFMGAGCSASAGLPEWDSLIRRLTIHLLRSQSKEQGREADDELQATLQNEIPNSPLIAARFFRQGFSEDFADRVKDALYEGCTGDPTSPLLVELSKLCLPPRGKIGVRAVVTYNFDDLLEEELKRKSVPYQQIITEEDQPTRHKLPVFHVHGLLPRRSSLEKAYRDSLVLSEEAYHLQFTEPYGWQNLTQLNFLRDYVCLFVGCSMTDPNQRRLLEIAQSKRPGARHYAIMRDHWKTAASNHPMLAKQLSVFRQLEEASLLRLGIRIVWVDNYSNIPPLISSIRGASSERG